MIISSTVSKAFQQHGEEVLKRLSGQQSSEEVPQQIRELREAIFDCIFGEGEEDDGFPGDPDEQNEHITARVLAMKALKGFRFDQEMEGWWNKVREEVRAAGWDPEHLKQWDRTKEQLKKEDVDVPKTQEEATEALNDLETLWKEPDKDVGKQLQKNKGQPIFQRLSEAIKAGVLLEADLTRWEYLIDSFGSAAEEIEGGEGDVDEVDGDASKEEMRQLKEAKQKSKARIRKFLDFAKKIDEECSKNGAYRERLLLVQGYQSTAMLGHDVQEEDVWEGHSTGKKTVDAKLVFAFAALACAAAVKRVLSREGTWDNYHWLWWRALHDPEAGKVRTQQTRQRGEEEMARKNQAWFERILRLVKDEFGGDEAIKGFLETNKDEFARLGDRVTDVVGCAKELLDATSLLGSSWCCSDSKYRRVKRVIISQSSQLPTLDDWKRMSGNANWTYDPFGPFLGKTHEADEASTGLVRFMAGEMQKDEYHQTDLCCILVDDEVDTVLEKDEAVVLFQEKFTSRLDVRWRDGYGSELEKYALNLSERLKEETKTLVVDAVWSTTSIFAPAPFGKRWSPRIRDDGVQAFVYRSKKYGSLTMTTFGRKFGSKVQFEGMRAQLMPSDSGVAGSSVVARCPSVEYKPRNKMQADAIEKSTEGVMTRKPVQVIMPCGFGKTFVAYRVARAVLSGDPSVRYVIIATPLQRLSHQGVQDWLDYDEYDPVFGKDHIVACTSSQPTGILHVPPTEIAKWLGDHATNNDTDGLKPIAVFMCYHSLAEVRKFCKKHANEIFLICDEAHACVGPLSGTTGSSEGAGRYTIVHSEIRSRYRMFQTATPKVHWANAGEGDGKNGFGFIEGDRGGGKRKDKYDRDTFACMNDKEGVFGECVYEATWQEAIEEKLLVEPRIRLLDASGLGLSEDERRLFSNYRLSFSGDTARRLIGLDDDSNDDGADGLVGSSERLEWTRLRGDSLRLDGERTEQKRKVDDLEGELAGMKEAMKDFPKRNLNDEQRQAKETADAKQQELKTAHAMLRRITRDIIKVARKHRVTAHQNSVRLYDFLANILHAVATCPESGSVRVSHVVSYHTTVQRAAHAMGLTHFVAAALIDDYASKGDDVAVNRLSDLTLGVVSSYQSPGDQEATIQRFAVGRCGIIFNVGIMRVGQNVPQINGVAFTDAMRATDDIVQCIGRGLRLYGDADKVCHVFVPVYGNAGGNGGGQSENGPAVDRADEESVDSLIPKPHMELVQDFLKSLPEQERQKLLKEDDNLEAVYARARKITEAIAGFGPQDIRVIGALCGPGDSGKRGNTNGILSARKIPKRVELRSETGVGNDAAPMDEENLLMLDFLNAGSLTNDVQGFNMVPEAAEEILVAMFRCATRTTFTGSTNRSGDLWWLARYDALKAHLDANGGEYPVQGDASGLGNWILTQRPAYKKPEGDPARLSAHRIALLEQLPGWTWNALGDMWPSKYEALKAHLEANRGEYPARGDASGLGNWIHNQRTAYKKPETDPGSLSADRIALLEQLLGWTWKGRFKKPTKTAAATCSQPQPKKKPRVIETSSSDETMGDVDPTDSTT